MNLTDISKETRLFALFIGRSGSGKTIAAASLPKPLQELDFDIRANGLINAVNQGWLDDKDIDIVQFDPFKGYLEVEKHLNTLYMLVQSKSLSFKSIDLGSATSLIRLLNLTSLNATKGIGHLNLGNLAMTGPGDYKFESQASHKIFDFLRILPCNITVSAHIIDKYGKLPGSKDTDPQVIIGEKLTLGTANLAENILAIFNDTYKFSKEVINNKDYYFVEFNTEIAKNSFGIPPGKFNITQKSFWNFFQELTASIKNKTFKPPTQQNQNLGGGGFAI